MTDHHHPRPLVHAVLALHLFFTTRRLKIQFIMLTNESPALRSAYFQNTLVVKFATISVLLREHNTSDITTQISVLL